VGDRLWTGKPPRRGTRHPGLLSLSLLSVGRIDHITPTLRDGLHWLPVHRRIEYKRILFVFKCRHQMAPSYLPMMCAPLSASDSRRHRNRSTAQGDLDVPFSRISYGERSFAVSGPTCWNALQPSELKLAASTLDHFCSRLKTVLFIRSYYAL